MNYRDTYFTPPKDRFLFRGKSPYTTDSGLKEGDWVVGSLELFTQNNPNTGELMCTHFIKKITEMHCDDSCGGKRHVVEPSTIGQCTGLLDKNGKLIFEGDICATRYGDVGKIRRHKNTCSLVIDFPVDWEYLDTVGVLEIIGNIHDNPELLPRD
ncbi:hypothetical protein FACS189490_12140 [Clostridia bacterium]|nr:hypothetical protein FACS189490_12140 [Clostridia bacterium]